MGTGSQWARRRQRKAEKAVAYVLHKAWSWAQLRASPADRPQSEQIWCSQDDPTVCARLERVELRYGRRMPRAELLCLTYVQRDRTEKDVAGEPSTGYSVDAIWCKPQHSWWNQTMHLMPRILLWQRRWKDSSLGTTTAWHYVITVYLLLSNSYCTNELIQLQVQVSCLSCILTQCFLRSSLMPLRLVICWNSVYRKNIQLQQMGVIGTVTVIFLGTPGTII